jgi:hypothetical protein
MTLANAGNVNCWMGNCHVLMLLNVVPRDKFRRKMISSARDAPFQREMATWDPAAAATFGDTQCFYLQNRKALPA